MSNNKTLTKSQMSAIEHMRQCAISRKTEAQKSLQEVLQMSDISWSLFEQAISKLRSHARVALHFHPDRPVDGGTKSVAEALLEQGLYKSQFETRISNGSTSAFPGGARDLWERKLFGGAYHLEGATDSERPKYGALDVRLHPDGPSPRFGACYFLLDPEVSRRCTYTYGGSQDDPPEKGTYEEFDDIAAALFKDAFFRECAIGEKELTPQALMHHLLHRLEQPVGDLSRRQPGRNLNHYIEVQVHGDIDLCDDAAMLVADPSFQGTRAGAVLEQLCETYSIQLLWHMGFSLLAADVPADFRGPAMPSLAMRIARNGHVDANAIGEAVCELHRYPARWEDRGTHADVLQELKYMWHILVRYGKPFPNQGLF
ncbi:MAG: hypothetical protein K0Q59_311 [Paenibacillus sp.]|jgi:hypothetical protein|nr:hypothetical protein [Paenibacillus sp.]